MKKKILLCCLTSFFLKGSLFAILPPLYNTLAEFKTVIESPELTRSLQSGEAILSITRDDNAQFTVLTNKHKLLIDVVNEPTVKIGPAKFHLEFHDPEPILR